MYGRPKQKTVIDGLLFEWLRCSIRSIHCIERMFADRDAAVIARPRRRNIDCCEMIGAGYQHVSLCNRQLPVDDGFGRDQPRLVEGVQIVDVKRTGCGGRCKLMRRSYYGANCFAVATLIATTQRNFRDSQLTVGRFAASFQIDSRSQASLISDGLRHQ